MRAKLDVTINYVKTPKKTPKNALNPLFTKNHGNSMTKNVDLVG